VVSEAGVFVPLVIGKCGATFRLLHKIGTYMRSQFRRCRGFWNVGAVCFKKMWPFDEPVLDISVNLACVVVLAGYFLVACCP
jgi:hypothetical protein